MSIVFYSRHVLHTDDSLLSLITFLIISSALSFQKIRVYHLIVTLFLVTFSSAASIFHMQNYVTNIIDCISVVNALKINMCNYIDIGSELINVVGF